MRVGGKEDARTFTEGINEYLEVESGEGGGGDEWGEEKEGDERSGRRGRRDGV